MSEEPVLSMSKVLEKINYWIIQLQDMGRRNRLLYFRKTKSSTLSIKYPDCLFLFEYLVINDKPIYSPLEENFQSNLFSEEQQTNSNYEDLYKTKRDEFRTEKTFNNSNKVLKNLGYRSRTVREEQGINTLYLTFGMLKWQDGIGGEYYEAPLILVPIDIVKEESGLRLGIKLLEEEVIVNPTLSIKLSNDFDIILDEEINDLTTDSIQSFWENTRNKTKKMIGWKVTEKSVIGMFNFQTMMLIKDLQNNIDVYKSNSIIRLLSGQDSKLIEIPDNIPTDDQLDDVVDPLETFQILDADSSQQEAIEAAKRGLSFVLQGPPGTGKSQTIANIISELMADGKKILFVSQKSVALDVVHKRLSNLGLGEFCLKVHSYRTNKKDVIQELGKSLDTRNGEITTPTKSKRQELGEIKRKLNQYVEELYKPRFELGLNLRRVYGEISTLYDFPNLKFSFSDIKNIDESQFRSLISDIRKYQQHDSVILEFDTHPWKGFEKKEVSLQFREETADHFNHTAKLLGIIKNDTKKITQDICRSEVDILKNCYSLVGVLKIYKPNIFAEEYEEIIDRFSSEYATKTRYFKLKFWKDKVKLSRIQWNKEKYSFDEVLLIVRKVFNLNKSLQKNKAQTNQCYQISLSEISDYANLLDNLNFELEFARNLYREDTLPVEISLENNSKLDNTIRWFEQHAKKVNRIMEWVSFATSLDNSEQLGLSDFIQNAISQGISTEDWENVFKRRFYILYEDAISQSNTIIQNFSTVSLNTLIEKFKELDIDLIRSSSLEIRDKLYQSRPDSSWIQAKSAETTILRREMNKKRRIKPLRRLFHEIPNLILNLRPCLMMSPLTVCQLLDTDLFQFDIAIFDEASQIPPEYALGTIIRAKQLVIAGDRHQLPPTRFFQSESIDEFDDDDYEAEDYESILDACDAINLPNKMLRWHYRSEDESLIAFSNFHFYGNKLLTFPAANRSSNNSAIEFHRVNGIYRAGKGARNNPIEARAVAEHVVSILKNNPNLSIGIVTFSQSQRFLIEGELEQIQKNNHHLTPLFDYNKEERLFVKNLEMVQGDERDIIIFSIGYGKDELDRIKLNFGPLNKQGGERRLNVAVSRARKSVKVFSSIDPEDIDLSRAKSHGARLLRNYLKVARDGITSILEDAPLNTTEEFESPFEEAVYEKLTSKGLILHKQVGVSKYRIDFGVVDPTQQGRYILGIECDGATYHSSPTARDRDRLRQQILEDKFHWKIQRIWSYDWINNPEREADKIIRVIEQQKHNFEKSSVKKN